MGQRYKKLYRCDELDALGPAVQALSTKSETNTNDQNSNDQNISGYARIGFKASGH